MNNAASRSHKKSEKSKLKCAAQMRAKFDETRDYPPGLTALFCRRALRQRFNNTVTELLNQPLAVLIRVRSI